MDRIFLKFFPPMRRAFWNMVTSDCSITILPQFNRTSMEKREIFMIKIIPSKITHCTTECACTHIRSEEHTSELQSRFDIVCRLLLEKKKATRCGESTCALAPSE